MKTSIYALTATDWGEVFQDKALNLAGLNYWLKGLYNDHSFWKRHMASKALEDFKHAYDWSLPLITRVQESEDGTVKFQMQFQDSLEVETVLIPFHKRYTICLSTQVGCAMNCSFCFTGTQGLKRNLTAGEIVGQYLVAFKWLLQDKPRSLRPSIVFMGQGEPLHNSAEVKKAIEVLNDRRCVGVGERQMTLSTVGHIPGIKELPKFPRINFALSLHSPFEEERTKLIPLNQKYPLDEVLLELDQVPLLKRQFITYEYLMIHNFNMSQRHADELAVKLSHRKAIINLIPFNPFPGSNWERPSSEEIESFKKMLVEKKLHVMLRTTKGHDILAACGQLKINKMARSYDRR